MAEKQNHVSGVETPIKDDGLRFDGTKLGLRDYAEDEVSAFRRAREGFVSIVETLIEVAPNHQDKLPMKGCDAVSLEKKLGRYVELTQALGRIEKLTEIVRETRLAVCDDLMNDIYRIHRVATAIGREDRDIHGAFDFIREWLSTGPRNGGKPSVTPGSATDTTPR
jgi:hypothetical protein